MTIRAELHDGRTLEFPDGTDSAVIQRVVKQQLGAKVAAPAKKPSTAWDATNGALGGFAESVRGMADQAFGAAVPGLPRGSFNALLSGAGRVADKAVSALGGPNGVGSAVVAQYQPQTEAGKVARTVGQMVPNALAPGGGIARAANVVVPAVTTELAGRGAKALGANERQQELARTVGGIAGGVGANVRLAPRAPRIDPDLEVLARRQDPQVLAARAAEYRAAGVEPTLADLVDDSGRGVVRAAASRMTPGREATTEFRDARALNLPDRIGGQARRLISSDPRTPDQIREATAASRSRNADQAFGAVRGQEIPMAPETVQALRNPLGRDAIAEAARRERNPEVRAALNRLHGDALDAPNTRISVGMADRIARTLLGRAQAAARAGDNDLAATFTELGNSVRNPASAAAPKYGDAIRGYAADSRLNEAAAVGEQFMSRNTDEFVDATGAMIPEETALAQAAARRSIERAAGENTSAAPGVARRLADAPEQQRRNAALLGPVRANELQNAMRLEERSVRNANDIAPRSGSQTQPRGQDAAQLADTAFRVGKQALRQDWLGIGVDWLRSRGMNDAQAERIVRQATSSDPATVNRALAQITSRYGPGAARQFRLNLNSSTVRGLNAPGSSDWRQPSSARPQTRP